MFKKSFADCVKAEFWNKNNEKTPRQVFKFSDEKYKFDCECGHSFETVVKIVTKGGWCPYCSNPPKNLCNDKRCRKCFNKSFASHEKSNFWSQENDILPRNVFKSSNKKFKFNCDCGHSFYCTPSHINSDDNWCPHCSSPPKKLCYDKKCKLCLENSFASHQKALFWSKKNKINPRRIMKSSIKKYIFDCNECGKEYIGSLNTISCGHWCNCTKNKTEKKTFEWLSKKYETEKQKKFSWCMNDRHLPFDFYIKEYRILIELDGRQHFISVDHWHSDYNDVQNNDIYKMRCAVKNGYTIIRLLQTDVHGDKNRWAERLKSAIKSYDKPTIIYLDNNNEYDSHKELMNDAFFKEEFMLKSLFVNEDEFDFVRETAILQCLFID